MAHKQEGVIEAFKKTSAHAWTRHSKHLPEDTPVEVWFQDEARIGQKNGLVYHGAHVYRKRQALTHGPRRDRVPASLRRPALRQRLSFGAVCPTSTIEARRSSCPAPIRLRCRPISMRSAATLPTARMPLSCLTRQAGTPPASSRRRGQSDLALPAAPIAGAQSNGERMAISCARYLAVEHSSSKPTTTSSTPPATPGASSTPTQKGSHQSACECGRMSVTAHELSASTLSLRPGFGWTVG